MQKHITAVAALHIGFGILGIVVGLVIFALLSGIGMLVHDHDTQFILWIIGVSVGSFLIIISVPGVIAGIGLLKFKNWARILVLIISAIDLLNIPFGTALGVYSIWVLVQEETIQIFNSSVRETNTTSI
jgi:hypothetical protein